MAEHKELRIDLGNRTYPIWIGQGLLPKFTSFLQKLNIDTKKKILIITDSQVGPLYSDLIKNQLSDSGYTSLVYTVQAGESSKSLEQYGNIMTYAIEEKLDRHSLIIALGGGVIGDLAGFVASTFMRGIPFIQVPTTILAHDSSVGGKVGINHPLGKNMIGSFFQPLAVIYDTDTLKSLPQREVISGFAEVLKHAFIWDTSFIDWLVEHREECLALQEPFISEALYRGCHIKTLVVAEDETEQGLRAILNFGHTFGHAFESLGEYTTFTHGEAISIGMVLASRLSDHLNGSSDIESTVTHLLHSYGLPVEWSHLPWTAEQILEKMYSDKKVVAASLNLILLSSLGKAEIVKGVAPEAVLNVIKKGERIL
jgi:3-dehydroquinate synthase